MILLLCSRGDTSARLFVEQRAPNDIALVTCRDLSRSGWTLEVSPGGTPPSRKLYATVNGRQIAAHDIAAVVTRLPFVTELEVDHIHKDDRAYVAAEMHAFLFAFLSALSCAVINRPTPACLLGPNWRWLQWRHAAVRLGIPVVDAGLTIRAGTTVPSWPERLSRDPGVFTSISVVGDRTCGDAAAVLHRYALELARAARLDLLRAWFTAPDASARLAGCDLLPDIATDDIGGSLLRHLDTRVSC